MATYVGGPNDDTFGGTPGNDTAIGNGGNDVLAGSAGADTLDGGDGYDTLYSGNISPQVELPTSIFYTVPILDRGTEVDTLRGGADGDTLFAGYGDNVDGGSGFDTLYISFQGASSGVTAHFDGGTIVIGGGTITNVEDVVYIEGSNFDDDLTASTPGYGDLSSIFGMGGNDHLLASADTFFLSGGDGNDIIDSRPSYYISEVHGDAGDDTIYANSTAVYGDDGNDTIYADGLISGGAGDDTIFVNSGYFTAYVYGGSGADKIVGSNQSEMLSSAGQDNGFSTLDTGIEHDTLSGGDGSDVISIGYGDDADGGAGDDTLILSLSGGTAGVVFNTNDVTSASGTTIGGGTIRNFEYVDLIYGTNFDDVITVGLNSRTREVHGGSGNDTLTISGSAVVAYGDDGDDTIIGDKAANTIHGGGGADHILAGPGNDSIYIDSATDIVAGEVIDGGSGIDWIYATNLTVDLSPATVTHVEMLSGYQISMTADQLAHFSSVNAQQVTLTTGGKVSLSGAQTNIFSIVLSNAGTTISFDGASNHPYSGYYVQGGSGNDTIVGSAGDDNLTSGGGRDTLSGGAGNDTFLVGLGGVAPGSKFDGGAGVDRLYVTANVDLSKSVLTGLETLSADYNLTPSLTVAQFSAFTHFELSSVILTTAGTVYLKNSDFHGTLSLSTAGNVVDFTGNDDFLTIQGNIGNDIILGSQSSQIVYGGGGNDLFAGHGGGDFFDGGDGIDTVDFSWAKAGVVVDLYGDTENTGGGGYITLLNVENIIGTKYNDILAASDAGSVLTGGSGDDTLFGGLGVDNLLGGAGTDSFIIGNPAGIKAGEVYDGGSGVDTLHLNFNSDSDLSAATLIRVEYLDQTYYDYDTKLTAAQLNALIGVSGESFTLTTGGGVSMNGVTINAHVFNLSDAGNTFSLVGSTQNYLLTVNGGAGNDIITGGALDDTINGGGGNDTLTGGAGNDAIDGGTGADRMYGGAGDDTFVVDNAADRVYEAKGDGTDTVLSSVTFHLSGQYVENLTLTGNDAINGTGNQLDNVLIGNAAANYLVGGDGNDQLHGGLGMDKLAGSAGNDQFWFDTALGPDNVDTIMDFAKGDSIHLDANIFGALSGGALADTAFYAGTAAHDADDRIIYDAKSGNLWYDADGSGAGAAVLFAHVNGHAALTAGDFFVA